RCALAAEGTLPGRETARPAPRSLPGVPQHVRWLEHAGPFRRGRDGRRRPCQTRRERLAEAMTWLNSTRRAWEARFDRLARFLHDTSQPNDPKGTNHGPEK